MLRSKAIVWITAGTLLCVAGVALACRMQEEVPLPETGESTTTFKAEYPVAGIPAVKPPIADPNEAAAGLEPDSPPPPVPVANAPVSPVAEVPPPPPSVDPLVQAPPPPPPAAPEPGGEKAPQTPPAPAREPQTSLLQPVPPVATPVPSEPPPSMAVLPVPTTPAVPPMTPPAPAAPPEPVVQPPAMPTPVATSPEPKKLTQTALVYQVRTRGETFLYISKELLGTAERWREIETLNPALQSKGELALGTWVMVPPDSDVRKLAQAVVPASAKAEVDSKCGVEPVPAVRAVTPTPRVVRVVLPLTGTFNCKMDDGRVVTLPGGALQQMGNVGTLLMTPGLESCLWLTTPSSAERLLKRVEQAEISDEDAVAFRKIYFARSEKVTVDPTGRITISEDLAKFGGLGKEIVLVGVDDHFELWDAARWQRYSQDKRIIKKHSSREKSRKGD